MLESIVFNTSLPLPSFIAFAVILFVGIILSLQRHIQNFDAGSKLGCEEPPRLQNGWLGLKLFRPIARSAKNGHLLKLFTKIVEETGMTFDGKFFWLREIDTVDPENIEAVLSSRFNDYSLGDRRQIFFPLLGDGIFTQDGSDWKHSRQLLRPQFSRNHDRAYEEIQKAVEKLIRNLQTSQNSVVVDLQPLFFQLTLETTLSLLFGQALSSLDSEVVAKFSDAFALGQDYLVRRQRLGPFYWLIGGKEFKQTCSVVHEFVDHLVFDTLKRSNSKASESTEGYIFLDALIEEANDPILLRSQLLNMLVAGRDTTACLLSWTFYLLRHDQRILQKLRQEIAAVVGDRAPTQAELKRLSYVHQILKEVLRLYPSVPVNSRTAIRQTILPIGGGPDRKSPILVEEGNGITYSVYIMQRRRDIYGDDANVFRPERWDEEGFERSLGWAYLPFNGGPRVCLGQEFALLEATYATVRMVQAFREILPGTLSLQEKGECNDEGNVIDIGGIEYILTGDEKQTVSLVMKNPNGCVVQLQQ